MADERKKQLLNLISDVKARLEGKVDSVAFPIPQFIVIGKQSVGKSRLIEALAGETFNFVSGTLGSRRPTVLEFRNAPGQTPSRWSVFDDKNAVWLTMPVQEVMRVIGQAHEQLGHNVSETPVRVKVEGADAVDLGVVDLPGFRAYAKDAKMQDLAGKIDRMVTKFMNDENNVMLCVEEAGDAAGFSTLGKCKQVDPSYRRTVLIRNKLDKYYNDLTTENVNKWLEGFGDLPPTLIRFAISLPHWPEGAPAKSFTEMRKECSDLDIRSLASKGASSKYAQTIGFTNFQKFIQVKIQKLFADALGPMLSRLNSMREEHHERLGVIATERDMSDENNVLHATQSAGITFAQSFNYLMEGALSSEHNRITMEDELRSFHRYCDVAGCLASEDRSVDRFEGLEAYISYLRNVAKLPGMDVQLNGGAQFRRLMIEVEIFTRFAGLGSKFKPQDVIMARGSGMRSTGWEDVISSLMMHCGPVNMRKKATYVGERLKWFFTEQKECTVQFMLNIKGSPEEHMFSRLISKQAQVIQRNETMKSCIFRAFDESCEKNRVKFLGMWDDYVNSMFGHPLKLLKTCSMPTISEPASGGGSTTEPFEELAPTFDSTKARIEREVTGRANLQTRLRNKIKEIPDEDFSAGDAVAKVQEIIEETFAVIRCLVADQMQLYSESFFLLPMLRRLEGAMAVMELAPEDQSRYRARKAELDKEATKSSNIVKDLEWCIAAVQKFKVTCGGL